MLQIAWGYLRLAHQMRFVPQPVMAGFVNALALLILLAQLPQLGLDVFHPEKVAVTAGPVAGGVGAHPPHPGDHLSACPGSPGWSPPPWWPS